MHVHALAREFELAKMMSLKIVEKQFVHKLPKHKVCSTNFSVCYETSDVSKKWAAISGIFNSVSLVKFLYLAILPSLYLYFGFHQCFDDTNTHTSPTRCTNEWIKSKDLSAKRPISRLWCEHSQILCSKHAFAKKKKYFATMRIDGKRFRYLNTPELIKYMLINVLAHTYGYVLIRNLHKTHSSNVKN